MGDIPVIFKELLESGRGFNAVKNIKLRGLQLLSSNERGSTFEMYGQSSRKVFLVHRTRDSVSGNALHFAKPGGRYFKNLLLISGKIRLDARDVNTSEEIAITIDAPTQIKIYSNVQYTLTAITECYFLEFSSKEKMLLNKDL